MDSQDLICVYCGNRDLAFFTKREHVIPQSFGTFDSETPTLQCVCDGCNSFFMRELDQLLARETLEGITRYKKGRFSRETREQKELRFSLADVAEVGAFAGSLVAGVDGRTGKLLPPAAQFQVLNIRTGRYDFFLRREISRLTLTDDMYGKTSERQYRIVAASQDEHDAIVRELRAVGVVYHPKGRLDPPFLQGKTEETVETEVQIEGTIDDPKKRAFVKVLFNFATYYLGASETLKPEWDKARQFVRFAGETLRARITTKPFWDGQETEHFRFPDDSYNLRIQNLNGNIVGVIQFFNLFTYEFILAEGYSIGSELQIAYRFTPGEKPLRGANLTHLY